MGMGKSKNISTKATADSMAVTVSLRMRSRSPVRMGVVCVFACIVVTSPGQRPDQK